MPLFPVFYGGIGERTRDGDPSLSRPISPSKAYSLRKRQRTMTLKMNIKAGNRTGVADNGGRTTWNHNETQVRTRGLKVKTSVKAGNRSTCATCSGDRDTTFSNHNETQADSRSAQRTRGFKIKSGVKAGPELRFPPFLRNP